MPICFLVVFSCKNRNEELSTVPLVKAKKKYLSDYLGENILKDFEGIVTDSIGNGLDRVSITIGNTTTFTDKNGKFTIKHTMVNEHFSFLNAKKEGYKDSTFDISNVDSLKSISIQLYKESDLSLFWFSKNNHNLPQTVH